MYLNAEIVNKNLVKQIKIDPSSLHKIKDDALVMFKERHVKWHDADGFVARCYIDAFTTFLNKNGVEVELIFPEDNRYITIDSKIEESTEEPQKK